MKNLHLRPPSKRQSEVLAAIASSITARGKAPTLREVGQLIGMRRDGQVVVALNGLVRRGLIERHGKGGGSATLTPAGARLALNLEPCAACGGTGRRPCTKAAA